MRTNQQNLADGIAALREQLTSVTNTLAKLANAVNDGDRTSFSIKEFIARNGLSASQFHKLQREGHGPRVMRTGNVGVRISADAERAWIKEREKEAANKKIARPKFTAAAVAVADAMTRARKPSEDINATDDTEAD
jgi:hypothetical protein